MLHGKKQPLKETAGYRLLGEYLRFKGMMVNQVVGSTLQELNLQEVAKPILSVPLQATLWCGHFDKEITQGATAAVAVRNATIRTTVGYYATEAIKPLLGSAAYPVFLASRLANYAQPYIEQRIKETPCFHDVNSDSFFERMNAYEELEDRAELLAMVQLVALPVKVIDFMGSMAVTAVEQSTDGLKYIINNAPELCSQAVSEIRDQMAMEAQQQELQINAFKEHVLQPTIDMLRRTPEFCDHIMADFRQSIEYKADFEYRQARQIREGMESIACNIYDGVASLFSAYDERHTVSGGGLQDFSGLDLTITSRDPLHIGQQGTFFSLNTQKESRLGISEVDKYGSRVADVVDDQSTRKPSILFDRSILEAVVKQRSQNFHFPSIVVFPEQQESFVAGTLRFIREQIGPRIQVSVYQPPQRRMTPMQREALHGIQIRNLLQEKINGVYSDINAGKYPNMTEFEGAYNLFFNEFIQSLPEQGLMAEEFKQDFFPPSVQSKVNRFHQHPGYSKQELWSGLSAMKSEIYQSVESNIKRLRFDDPKIGCAQGAKFFQEKKYHAALACFNSCIPRIPQDQGYSEILFMKGVSHLLQNELNQAKQDLNSLLQQDANNIDAHLCLANIYSQENDTLHVIDHLTTVVKLDQNNDVALFHLGVTYAAQDQHVDAVSALEKAVVLQPSHTESRKILSGELLSLGRIDDAMTHLDKYLELQPNDQNMCSRKDYLYYLRDFRDAKFGDIVQRSTERLADNPNDQQSLLFRANANLAQRHAGAAIVDFRTLLAENATNTEALIGLGNALVVKGKHQTGLSKYKEALRILEHDTADTGQVNDRATSLRSEVDKLEQAIKRRRQIIYTDIGRMMLGSLLDFGFTLLGGNSTAAQPRIKPYISFPRVPQVKRAQLTDNTPSGYNKRRREEHLRQGSSRNVKPVELLEEDNELMYTKNQQF